ncbi:MAG TPA: hypothetical protein P5254_10285 [Aquihabitans sp.]|nr:hypothetical protein [Aquihabitans sp.]
MAEGHRQGSGSQEPRATGATEPITLTDPDGAVTRVAPWSSWTREQVRAPGGEPALVTRLEQGQLWFSAGRRRSPWRHEVHVGPAIVSTPRGRFQAVAESDGGATISCLAGRTRVVAGLREPVLLGPDQSAAVSSDGRTLVVMDRATSGVETPPDVIDLTDGALADEEAAVEAGALAAVGVGERGALRGAAGGSASGASADEPASPATDDGADDLVELRSARLGWIPELLAVVALVTVLVAIVWVFLAGDDDADQAAAPAPTATTAVPTTSEAPTTTGAVEIGEPATTDAVSTTVATTLPPLAAGASASGELRGCRRAEGGVAASVLVTHRGGPASSFDVTAALVDSSGASFAEGTERSPLVEPGSTAEVEVLVPFDGRAEGSCELVSVTGG